jgi:hypothetical protein
LRASAGRSARAVALGIERGEVADQAAELDHRLVVGRRRGGARQRALEDQGVVDRTDRQAMRGVPGAEAAGAGVELEGELAGLEHVAVVAAQDR